MHFLIWMIENQSYAIDLAAVDCIVLACEIISIPSGPNEVMGAINIHGQIAPVINTRLLLGLPLKEIEISNHFIIAHVHHQQIALFVDRVNEVRTFKREDLTPAQESILNVEIDYIVKDAEQVIFVVNLDKLIPAYAMPSANEET